MYLNGPFPQMYYILTDSFEKGVIYNYFILTTSENFQNGTMLLQLAKLLRDQIVKILVDSQTLRSYLSAIPT